MPEYVTSGLVALLVSLIVTRIVSVISVTSGRVSRPRPDRWHRQPTALFGGVAIYLGFITALSPQLNDYLPQSLGFFLGSTLIFLLGFWDDVWPLSPKVKLVGQILAALVLVQAGVITTLFAPVWLNWLFTILWIVLMTNAFNLIDNMDGLAAGVAVISSVIMFGFSHFSDYGLLQFISVSLAGAALGFLRYNVNPASVFMGDSGSMLLGYVLAGSAILGSWFKVAGLTLAVLFPLALFFIPLFDTVLVTLSRRRHGRSITQGGTDHFSHRLVFLGMSERNAVFLLWGLSALIGLLSLGMLRASLIQNALTLTILSLVALVAAKKVWRLPVYSQVAAARENSLNRLIAPAASLKSFKLSVIIPVYNERNTILEIIDRVERVPINKEIIVVCDGSTDGTRELLKERVVANPHLNVVFHPHNIGKGGAICTGLRQARGDVVIVQDADLELDPNDYLNLLQPILEGSAEVVFGSRFRLGKVPIPFHSKVANFIVTATANLLFDARITDEACGYKVMRTDVLRELNLYARGFEFCPEVTAKVRRLGYQIYEVPVRFSPRTVAEGKKIHWRDGFIAIWTLVKWKFSRLENTNQKSNLHSVTPDASKGIQ